MIGFLTRHILQTIDSVYHRKRIFNYLKKNKNKFKFKFIIDVGSNVGEYTELFKNINKNIEVACFEPQKKIFKILKKNLKNYKKIKIYNVAIGSYDTYKNLNTNLGSSYISSFSNFNKKSNYYKIRNSLLNQSNVKKYEKVKVARLDSFKEFKKKKIDLIKIDVEGYEIEVLKGMGKILENTEMIMIEIHKSNMYLNYNPKQIEKFLKNNGFKMMKDFRFPFLGWSDKIFIKN